MGADYSPRIQGPIEKATDFIKRANYKQLFT